MLLFSFTPSDALTFPAEADVHGLWQDDSTFVITTTLDVSTAGLKFGETQVEKLEIGTTAELYTSGLLVNGTQQCDVQPPQVSECVPMARTRPPDVPRLVGFTVEDRDNLDAVLSVGDEFHLEFDRETDQHLCDPTCRGGPEYVLRLFAFSAPLASDYIGYWVDNRTFTIEVTRVDPDFEAPHIARTIGLFESTSRHIASQPIAIAPTMIIAAATCGAEGSIECGWPRFRPPREAVRL